MKRKGNKLEHKQIRTFFKRLRIIKYSPIYMHVIFRRGWISFRKVLSDRNLSFCLTLLQMVDSILIYWLVIISVIFQSLTILDGFPVVKNQYEIKLMSESPSQNDVTLYSTLLPMIASPSSSSSKERTTPLVYTSLLVFEHWTVEKVEVESKKI